MPMIKVREKKLELLSLISANHPRSFQLSESKTWSPKIYPDAW
jgi:hypothetical protein